MSWLSRLLDRVPIWTWVAIGWCLLPLVKLFKSREVEEWR